MTRFHRSSHYRTNANGTTFKVRGHDVRRDAWEHASPSAPLGPRPARAYGVDGEAQRGILYPNASCPVCGDRVWFFEASNGGRVFFDSLWPDWDKHPCTIQDRRPLFRPTPAAGEEPDEEEDDDGMEAYPRPGGTFLRIGRDWVKGDLDLRARYFRHAWAGRDESGRITSVGLLRADLTPVTVPVEPCDVPPPLTDKSRRAMSTRMKDDLARVSRRIPGLANRTLVTDAATGSFVIGTLDGSRVLIIPVPTDQHPDERDPWGTRADQYKVLGKYMLGAALNALRYTEGKVRLPDDFLSRHHAVFVFLDPFRYHGTHTEHSYRSFLSEDGEIDISELDFWASESLSEVGIAEACWTDAADGAPIRLHPLPAEDETVLGRENAFCQANWPYRTGGQWKQILWMAEWLGVLPLLDATHKMLIPAGWGSSS